MYWKQGFYDNYVDGSVEITEDYYHELIAGQAEGLCIDEEDGYPILRVPAITTVSEIDTLKSYLSNTDWCVIKCMELGCSIDEIYPEISQCRKDARQQINILKQIINQNSVAFAN